MVIEPFVQCSAGINILALTTFSGTFRYCFANINRAEILIILVDFGQSGVSREVAYVVECIYAGSDEAARRKRLNILLKKSLCYLFAKVTLIQRIVGCQNRDFVIISWSHSSSSFPFDHTRIVRLQRRV